MSIETIGIIAIIFGPVSAIIISLWYQSRKQKRETKEKLFSILMGQRGTEPPSHELVSALNRIDVVFYNCPKVLAQWHKYYDILHQDWKTHHKQREDNYNDLLYEIACSLGYKTIKQTDIGKFITPRGLG